MATTNEILESLFRELMEKDSFSGEVTTKIALISTPRCGSSFFCDTLRNSERVGFPAEWINLRYFDAYAKVLDLGSNVDLGTYLNFIFSKTTTSNGIFSINFHIEQYLEMKKRGFDVTTLGFDKVYYLYRKDKLAQAHSLIRAAITDQWTADASGVKDFDEEKVSRSHLLQALSALANQEEEYTRQLKHLVSREFAYEDFSGPESAAIFQSLFTDLDLGEIDVPESRMQKQSKGQEKKSIASFKRWLGL